MPRPGGGVFNTPWSYKTWLGKVDATYRLKDGYSLLGGAEYTSQDRWVPSKGTLYVPFRSDLDELTLRAGVRKAMSETVNGSLTYMHSNRDGGHYTVPGDPTEDKVNPMNIADRKRNKIRGVVDWAPVDRMTLTLTGEYAHDDYSGLPFGLEKGKAYTVGAGRQLPAEPGLVVQCLGHLRPDQGRRDDAERHTRCSRTTC